MNPANIPVPILLVDDDPAWLRSLRLTLRRADLSPILTCADSRNVLGILDHLEVGLLLIDHGMPHLNGEELLIRLREDHPHIPVIVLSALPQVETACRCIQQGALAFLSKVRSPCELLGDIQSALIQPPQP